MAIEKRGQHSYGDNQADIRTELITYSKHNAYVAEHFAEAVCVCGHKTFHLVVDDEEGAAIRICTACEEQHPIGDSKEYLEDAELEECECPCGEEAFEITAGVALYAESNDVKWLYLGCRCPACGLTACYADWKNEYEGYEKLLANI